MSARARRRELALERSALENGVVVVVACMATRGRRDAGEGASTGRERVDGRLGVSTRGRRRIARREPWWARRRERFEVEARGWTRDGPFDRSTNRSSSFDARSFVIFDELIQLSLTHRVMLRLRGGRRRERKTRTLASTAARAAMSFVLYARDMVPEVMTVVEEEEDEQSATTSGRDGDDNDDAMDVATDGDDDEKDAMKMPFNAPTLTLRRTRVGSRTTRRGEPGGSRSRDERAKARREDETRRALDTAFNARAMEILRPRSIVMMIGSTPHRPREVYELDLRAVEYVDEDSDDEDEDDAKKIRDAVSRRAIRAFVPLVADCAPPGPRSGLRAFFFVEASTPRDDDDVAAPPPGFVPKRAFAPSLARCVERRRVRVVRDDDDDNVIIDDVLDDRLRREDGWTWYQASASIRASRR